MALIDLLLSLIALVLLVPSLILAGEVLLGLLGGSMRRASASSAGNIPRSVILVPAHNEEEGITATIETLRKDLPPSMRILVIADNCSDGTAAAARLAGAEVVERHDATRRGKGYALDFGLQHLKADPPEQVMIVDADCRIDAQSLAGLAVQAGQRRRAAQALYLMHLPPDPGLKQKVAAFAWIVRNHLRPKGLAVLGLPCQLMGTGMAIPWAALGRIGLASGNIVEDVQMGLDLARIGAAPVFSPAYRVESAFPSSEQGFASQRQRWETGSLSMLLKVAPRNIWEAVKTGNGRLLAMSLDLLVPPVMMHLAALIGVLALASLWFLAGGSALPVQILGWGLILTVGSLFLAWLMVGRGVLSPADLWGLSGVFLGKLGLYRSMWRNRKAGWVRTDRK